MSLIINRSLSFPEADIDLFLCNLSITEKVRVRGYNTFQRISKNRKGKIQVYHMCIISTFMQSIKASKRFSFSVQLWRTSLYKMRMTSAHFRGHFPVTCRLLRKLKVVEKGRRNIASGNVSNTRFFIKLQFHI